MYEKFASVAILVLVYVLIISNVVHRSIAALLGAVLVVGLGIISTSSVTSYVHWEALMLIFGMFILVSALKEAGFFRWVGLHAVRFSRFDAVKLFVLFNVLTAILAAFMDSITVVIFMASLSIECCRLVKLPAAPFLISMFASANIGGSATMVGDPPNVILGTTLNFSFVDFATHTGPIAAVVLMVNIAFFYVWYRKLFSQKLSPQEIEALRNDKALTPFSAITDMRLMRLSLVIFTFTVTLFILHQFLDMLVAFAATLGATILLLAGGRKMPELIEKIDWLTLIFLACLFVVVGGLENSGILDDMAGSIVSVSGGSAVVIVTLLLWMSALMSSFLDNIPFVMAIIPVIKDISATTGMSLGTLTWTSALGADVGGLPTPVASSANVVGLAVAEKHGIRIGWKEFCRVAFPAMIACLLVTNALLLLFLI